MPWLVTCPACRRLHTAPPDIDAAPRVRCPTCGRGFNFAESAHTQIAELVVLANAPDEQESPSDDIAAVPAEPLPAPDPETPVAWGSFDFQEPGESPADAGGLAEGFVAPMPRAVAARRHPSAMRLLVGWVLSGSLGLAVGYYVLLWIGGPRRDFLEVGRMLPAWTVPAEFQQE